MNSYRRADFGRLLRSVKRWILTLLVLAAFGGITFYLSVQDDVTSVIFVNYAETILEIFVPLIMCVEYVVVFGDDFKAKTMQAAIGRGVTRMQVIWVKVITILFFSVVDILFLCGISVALSYVPSLGLTVSQITELFAYGSICGLITFGYVLFSLPIAFFTQNSALGFFSFLAFSTGIVKGVLSFALTIIPKVSDWNIQKYFFGNYAAAFQARILVGVFEPFSCLGMSIWMIAALLITWILFRKKELEF